MSHHETIEELRAPTAQLRAMIPGAWGAFTELHGAAMAEGAVPTRLKEATALAIAVVKQCDGCIAYHARAAARAGASLDEVAEMLAVALLMDGGTASVYGPRAWDAFIEFAGETAEVAAR
ncbi:MAG TPA: carboxymuconolactone decarboxylase family protein [Acidimicrobiales bacterium]|jgi:AhpD family alkylhydroperoxidase